MSRKDKTEIARIGAWLAACGYLTGAGWCSGQLGMLLALFSIVAVAVTYRAMMR